MNDLKKRRNGEGAINADGYIVFSRKYKFKYEHIEKAEKALGKMLPKGAQVHHVDENKSNNENTNLVICGSQKYHRLLHRRTRAYMSCGNAGHVRCRHCHVYEDPSLLVKDGPRSYSHRECRSLHRRSRYKDAIARGKSV